jgi:hypothetical protein
LGFPNTLWLVSYSLFINSFSIGPRDLQMEAEFKLS